jgi:uncharacterized protein
MLLNDMRVVVLGNFLGDYKLSFTASTIAREHALNQKSVANVLDEYEGILLASKMRGKNREFSLRLDDETQFTHWVSALEHLRAVQFLEKHLVMKEIAQKMLPACKGAILIFGSYAKGTAKPDSDLDIFIVGEYDDALVKRLSATYRLSINVKQYPTVAFQTGLIRKDQFLFEVIKNHICLKDAETFATAVRRHWYGQA